ncbi:MAG: hypothetical protein ACO3JL_19610, partial [Myxococcota bacterium]
MKTQLVVHGALLLVGATLAHLTYEKGEETTAPAAVTLAALSPEEVAVVEYEGPLGIVQVTPSGGQGSLRWQVKLTSTPPAVAGPAGDAGVDDGDGAAR